MIEYKIEGNPGFYIFSLLPEKDHVRCEQFKVDVSFTFPGL